MQEATSSPEMDEVGGEEEFDPRADEILAEGTVISGRYEINKHLAAGGMGRVYVATQAPLGRRVALKVMHRELCQDSDSVKRFFREAVAVSQLTHPNTITVFDYGESEDGNFFIAMEFLEGEPLAERLEREGPMSPDEAVAIAVQVGRSLSEAHRKNIVHRDLKPDNVFLGSVEKDLVKVLDFGIAKILVDKEAEGTKLTRMGFVCGTPEYMSPEQARGDELDGRSDLYALGVCLYEILSGEAPFVETTPLATVLKHQNAEPPPLPDHIPASLASFVIERAMAKDRDARPESAEQFIEELELAAVKSGLSRDSTGNIPREELVAASAALANSSGDTTSDLEILQQQNSKTYLYLALLVLLIGGGVIAYLMTQGDDDAANAATTQKETSAPVETQPTASGAEQGPQPVVLAFFSKPAGALIYREKVEPANLLGKTDEKGELRIELQPEADEIVDFVFVLEGYSDHTTPNRIPAVSDVAQDVSIFAELKKLFTVSVEPTPTDARIFVDGDERGVGPQSLAIEEGQSVELRIEAEGFETHVASLTPNQDDVFAVALEPVKTASKSKKRRKKKKSSSGDKTNEKTQTEKKEEKKKEEKKTGYEAFGD